MKTRRSMAAAWLALAVAASLTGGCGANTVAIAEAEMPETTIAAGTPAVTESGPAAAPSAVAKTDPEAPPAEGPAVQRSEKVLPPLRPEIAEVVQLIESGAGEEVARTFVSVSDVPYELTLDEIIYLRDIGIPDSVIAAMMRRGGELRERAAELDVMQTNLLATVEHLKEAIASGPATNAEAAPESVATAAPGTAAEAVPVQATTAPPDAPDTVRQFYSDLSPYGSWYQVPTYGWVWQPSVVVVNQSWVPYRYGGRWLWSDWGWYWCSDYSWGWAPFHYGRWCTYPGLGWCWVPGSVWGPSWVTWRSYGSHIGWAPLPPACGWTSGVGLTWHGSGVSVGFGFGLGASCYTFVPNYAFCYRNVGHHSVHHRQAGDLYQNSTVINNVIVGDNNTIINKGVGYEQVASHVRTEVPKAKVYPLPASASRPLRVDRMERAKDGYVVFRPTPVEGKGPQAVGVRSEVRPAGWASAAPVRGVPARSVSAYGSRPSAALATGGYTVGKPVDSRGVTAPVPTTGRSEVSSRSVSPAVRSGAWPSSPPASRTGTPSTASKAVESRSLSGAGTTAVPTRPGGTVRSALPQYQSAPAARSPGYTPLPSRTPSTTISKPAPESRGLPSTTVRNPYSVGATPNYGTAPSRSAAPSVRAPSVTQPRMAPSVPSMRAPVAPSAPRQTFSAPQPSYSAPRPSYSAPSPAMSAPRPSVSAPAPVMSAPRAPVMSAPRAPVAAPAPSWAPAPSPGGPRTRPN